MLLVITTHLLNLPAHSAQLCNNTATDGTGDDACTHGIFVGITHCVTTSAELQSTLAIAANNNQNDYIKVATGDYLGNGGLFEYDSTENKVLIISGGWGLSGVDPCGQKNQNTAFSTTLDADGSGRVLKIAAQGPVTIQDLSFINGSLNGDIGGGLSVYIEKGTAVIERNSFLNNHALIAGAVVIQGQGLVRFMNNLVITNESENVSSGKTVVVLITHANYAINNTIMFNTGGLLTVSSISQKSFIANNLLWNNENFDLVLNAIENGDIFLYNNNYESRLGQNPTAQSGNISVAPQFESGLLNFTPAWGSSIINSGKHPPFIFPIPIPFEADWDLGNWGFEGHARVQNGRVDIGAVEAPTPPDLIFASDFE